VIFAALEVSFLTTVGLLKLILETLCTNCVQIVQCVQMIYKAQLSHRDRAMLRIIEYLLTHSTSLKVIRIEKVLSLG